MSDREEPRLGSAAWIEAALRERLGPAATLGELVFEGRALHVRGARLPLGAAILAVDHAEIELGAGAPLGPYPIAARLVSLRGAILSASLTFTSDDRSAARWLSGAIRVGEILLGGRALTLEARVDLDPSGLSIRDGRAAIGAVIAAFSGRAVYDGDASVTADLELGTETTRLALTLTVDAARRLAGTRLTGRVDLADLLAAGGPAFDLTLSSGSLLDVDLNADGDLAAPSLRGPVFAPALSIGRASRPGSALRIEDLGAVVDLDRRRLRVRDLAARVHGARVAGWGRVPLVAPAAGAESEPLLALSFERVGPPLITAASSLAGLAIAARAIPADLLASGEIMITRDRAASLEVAALTARSHLRARIAVDAGGALEGSTLRGHLAAEDALTAGLFPGPVRPRPPAVLDVDARLTGTLARPGLTGRVESRRFILDVFADPELPSFLIEDASALLDLDVARIAWHRLAGRAYGGWITSSGRAHFEPAGAFDAAVSWNGVRVEQLPTQAEGESRLASLIHGASSGELTFTRHAVDGAPIGARGRVSIAEPRYFLVQRFAADLGRYGLPAVGSRGAGPLTARVYFTGEALFVRQIVAAVDGVDLRGDVEIAVAGRLAGALVLRVRESYLAQSALLAVPAALAGRIEIPVDLAGSVSEPVIRTDARSILESLLSRNRVGDTVKSVVDSLSSLRARRRKKR